jgi:uncharacterized membrane protein YadS
LINTPVDGSSHGSSAVAARSAAGYAFGRLRGGGGGGGGGAVVVKLTRTLVIITIVLGLSAWRAARSRAGAARHGASGLVPPFLVLFLVAAAAISVLPLGVRHASATLALQTLT